MRLLRFSTVAAVLTLALSARAETDEFVAGGIPVVLKSNSGTPVVSVQFVLKGGVPHYTPEQAGIEVMLFRSARKGTANYPKQELQEMLARTGATIGEEVLHDYSTLTLSCLRRDLEAVWPVFADVVVAPTLDPEEVRLVKERQLNDVRQAKDDPDSYLRLLADALHYEGHPYAASPDGTEEAVGRLDADALRRYHSREVNKARSLVVIVGDVDRSTAEALVARGLGKLPAGEFREPVLVRSGNVAVPETRLEERDLPTNYVRGYYQAPSLKEDDYVPMTVALSILRHRLFEEVRTKRNLTYAVSSGMASRRHNYGLLYVTAVEPDTTVRVMLHEVRRMQTEGISQKELDDQLKVQITRYLMGQQSNASQGSELCRYELVGAGWEGADRVVERMRAVTREDIQRVCRKYIQNIDFVMLGDPQKWKDPWAADRPGSTDTELH